MTTESVRADRVAAFARSVPDGSRMTDESFRSRHRMVLAATTALLPFVFLTSRLTGVESVTGAELPVIPLSHSVAGVGVVLVLLGTATIPSLSRRIRTSLASFGFMTTAAVLAYFSGGFIEAHFLYFVGVGVVALYEDWVPFGVAIGYVACQHSVFGLIEWFTVYNHPAALANPVVWGGIHAVFVSMLSVAILFHWQSLAAARDEIEARMTELEQTKREIEQAKREAEEKRREADRRREETAPTEAGTRDDSRRLRGDDRCLRGGGPHRTTRRRREQRDDGRHRWVVQRDAGSAGRRYRRHPAVLNRRGDGQ